MLSYEMAIQLASTLRQCKITHPRIHLKRFVKFRELEHGRQRELVLKLPKDLVSKLIPLLGYLFFSNKSDKVLATLQKS